MSSKQDRFNHRRYRRAPMPWAVPRDYKYWNTWNGRRWLRARSRQLIREGRFDSFPRYRRDAGYYYW